MSRSRTESRPKARPPASKPQAGAPTSPRSRTLEGAILALSLVGAALSVELALLHARAHAGGSSSFCAISERVNCDTVALSPWSVLLGVPLASWGALAYLAVAGLAAAALGRERPHPGWPAGLLSVATGLLAATAIALALVSELVIGAFCILCAGSWLVSFALAALAWRMARRTGGVGPALRADARALRARPGPTFGAAATVLLAAVALVAGYAGTGRAEAPRAAAPAPGASAPPPAPAPALPATPGAEPGSRVVEEFSDYACPFCARVHVTDKPLRAQRPDVRIVRRHFPLDDACNPKLTRPFHVGACQLARAGICAEAQGRFEAMDDALFANQAEKAPVVELARRVGLDLDRFDACLASPETEARLQRDIQAGIQAGIRGTPSYVVDGKPFPGDLAQLLGVPPAAGR